MPDVTPQAVLGWLVAPAIVFGLAYPSMYARLSLGLLSPYAKADLRKRIYAALLDGFIVMSLAFAFGTTGNVAYLLLAGAFGLLRDGIRGHSPGKFVLGLVVISVETGEPAKWTDSARRNLLFLLPGANIAAMFLEARTLLRDPQGQRLGDRFAQTQVVEGTGAAELVKELQDWLLALAPQQGRGPRRHRAPVRGRAA